MQKLILVFSFCLSVLTVRGQYTDTTHYHVLLSSTGSINKSNTDKAYLLNNALNFGVKKNDVVLNATSTWVYGKQNHSLTNNDFSGTLYVNLYKTFKHFYYWGLANYNTSYSLKVNNQLLAGLGAVYFTSHPKHQYVSFT